MSEAQIEEPVDPIEPVTDDQSGGDTDDNSSTQDGEDGGAGAGSQGTTPDELALLRRENAALQREASLWKTQHDAIGGKVGPKLSKLRARIRELESGGGGGAGEYGDDDGHVDDSQHARTHVQDPRVETLIEREQEKAERESRNDAEAAYSRTVARFDQEFPDLDKAIVNEVGDYVREHQEDVKSAIEGGNAANVEIVTDRLLTRAMRHAMSSRRAANVDANRERQKRLDAQKRDASAPGRKSPSSTDRSGGPMTETASLDEIKAELRRRGRPGF